MTRAVQPDLFRRHRRAPPASEFRLHCAIADLIRRTINPAWKFSHLPFGEHRLPSTAGRLARMGVTPGWPDFLFVSERGRFCFLEIKRHGGSLSTAQKKIALHLIRAGAGYLCTDSFDDAVATLTDWA